MTLCLRTKNVHNISNLEKNPWCYESSDIGRGESDFDRVGRQAGRHRGRGWCYLGDSQFFLGCDMRRPRERTQGDAKTYHIMVYPVLFILRFLNLTINLYSANAKWVKYICYDLPSCSPLALVWNIFCATVLNQLRLSRNSNTYNRPIEINSRQLHPV